MHRFIIILFLTQVERSWLLVEVGLYIKVYTLFCRSLVSDTKTTEGSVSISGRSPARLRKLEEIGNVGVELTSCKSEIQRASNSIHKNTLKKVQHASRVEY